MNNLIHLPTILALETIAAKDATRPYLYGVSVEFRENDALYIATDGRVLFARRVPSIQNTFIGKVFLPLKCAWSFTQEGPAPEWVGFEQNEKIAVLTHGELRSEFGIADIEFPDWRPLVPKPRPSGELPFELDHKLVASIHRVAKKLGLGEPIYHPNGMGPAVYSFRKSDDAFALLMPRGDVRGGELFPIPDWAR
jgi:hypothetical protein